MSSVGSAALPCGACCCSSQSAAACKSGCSLAASLSARLPLRKESAPRFYSDDVATYSHSSRSNPIARSEAMD